MKNHLSRNVNLLSFLKIANNYISFKDVTGIYVFYRCNFFNVEFVDARNVIFVFYKCVLENMDFEKNGLNKVTTRFTNCLIRESKGVGRKIKDISITNLFNYYIEPEPVDGISEHLIVTNDSELVRSHYKLTNSSYKFIIIEDVKNGKLIQRKNVSTIGSGT